MNLSEAMSLSSAAVASKRITNSTGTRPASIGGIKRVLATAQKAVAGIISRHQRCHRARVLWLDAVSTPQMAIFAAHATTHIIDILQQFLRREVDVEADAQQSNGIGALPSNPLKSQQLADDISAKRVSAFQRFARDRQRSGPQQPGRRFRTGDTVGLGQDPNIPPAEARVDGMTSHDQSGWLLDIHGRGSRKPPGAT